MKPLVALAAVIAVAATLPAQAAAAAPCLQTGMETVATDRTNYTGGDTAHVSGTGYAPGCDVVVRITRPDAVVDSSVVTTDALDGSLSYDYLLPGPPSIVGDFSLDVLGLSDTVLASTTFTDALTIKGDVTPSYVPGAATVTFRTLVRNTSNDTVIRQVNVDLPSGYTSASVVATAFSSGTWTPATPPSGFDFAFSLASGSPLATATGWARIDLTATTPASSAADWRFHACADVGCGGNGQSIDMDQQAFVLVSATPPADRYTADFRDVGDNIATPTLRNGAPATLRLRITSSAGGNNSTKYTAIALPICFGTPSAVSLTGGSGYSVTVRDGFIILQGGSLGNVGNFMTVQFNATPTGCGDGATPFLSAVTSNRQDDASGQNDLTAISGNYATVTMDSTKPNVTIDQASGQVDPTTVSPLHFTAVFDEPVTGFTNSDVMVSGTAGGTKTVAVTEIAPSNGTTYDVAVGGMTQRGTVVASIPAGGDSPSSVGAQDAAGNGNNASTSTDNTVTWDRVPAATAPTFSPASPKTNDLLQASTTTSDPDGDNVSVAWTWKVTRGANTCTIATGSSPSAAPGLRTVSLDLSQSYATSACTGASPPSSINPSKHDVVTAEATPNDGLFDGSMQSNTVAIANSAPTLTAPVFGLSAPKTNDTLTATSATADADGDNVSVAWVWSVNRGGNICTVQTDSSLLVAPGLRGPVSLDLSESYAPTSCTGPAISSLNPSKGDVVVLEATPTDDDASPATGATQSNSVAIVNSPPTVSLNGATPVDEGSTESYTFSTHDDDGDELSFSADYPTCGSGGDVQGSPTIGSGTFDCYLDDGPADTTVAVKVTDETDDSNEATTSVHVDNVDPTADFASNGPVTEGSPATVSFSNQFDPSGADTAAGFHYEYNCDGSAFGPVDYDSTGASSSEQCTFDDGPSTHVVRARIIDKDNGFSEYTTTVEVVNVDPTADLASNGPVDEDSPATISFSNQDDPSSADSAAGFHYAFSCSNGDLSGATYSGSGSNDSATCTYPDGPSSHVVRARIIDKDDGYTEYTTTVTVDNVAPTVTIDGPAQVNEGSTHTYTFTVTDPGDDTFAVNEPDFPNCGDNGSYVAGTLVTDVDGGQFDCSFADGPNTTNVAIRVTDSDGASDTGSEAVRVVAVENVNPTADLGNNGPVDEGSPATVSFSNQFDPSPADTAAGLHYAFSCANGDLSGATYAGSGTNDSTTCTFDDGSSSHTVKARIIDKNGGFNEYTTEVEVDNVDPTAELANDGPVDEGSPATVSFSNQADASSDDTAAGFRYEYHCDGSAFGPPDYATADTSASHQCTFDDNGTHTVQARAIDKDNGFTSYTTDVVVVNVAPTATVANNGPVDEGSPATVSFSDQEDASSSDTVAGFRYEYHCDGSAFGPPDYATADTSASHQCTFDDNGTHTVRARIIDKDNGFTSFTSDVEVENVAPDVTAAADQSSDEGEDHAFDLGSFGDPGADDPWAVSVDWGDGSSTTDFSAGATGSLGTKSHVYADGPNGYTVTVTVTDKDGGSGSATFSVHVGNLPPSTPEPTSPADNALINDATPHFEWSDSTDPAGAHDTITYRIQVDDDCDFSSPEIDAEDVAASEFTPGSDLADGTYCWHVRASDEDGDAGPYSAVFHVTLDTGRPSVTINQAAGQADPTSSAPIKFTVVFSEPVSDFSNDDVDLSASTAGGTLATNVYDSGDHATYEVRVNGMTTPGTVIAKIPAEKAHDDAGNENTASTSTDNTVTWQPALGNTTPVVTVLSPAFGSVYAKGSAAINPLTVKASFTDPDNGPWTYIINWDDGSPNASGSATPAPSTFEASHSYANPGVYTINVCVKDALLASGCAQVWIVVYDPNGGFVTGGGWLNVAAGSYRADPSLAGRANFGFNSQYKKNANVPTGTTEFNFQVGNFNFHSTAYSWLVVSGYKAQYRGTGTVNGVSGYDFTLTAYDGQVTGGGGVDRFRIRITQSNNGNVVFDNKYGVPTDMDVADPQAIAGGSIVIHKA